MSFRLIVFLCLSSLAAITLPGCGGCIFREDSADKGRDKKENVKPNFQADRLIIQPSDDTPVSKNSVKPGHWISGTQLMRANNFDFQAEIQSRYVDRYQRAFDVAKTKFRMESWRPASLPKGQTMKFELTYYIPRRIGEDSKAVQLQSSLRARHGGREVHRTPAEPTLRMPAHQYKLLVLSSDVEQYGYLKRLHSVSPPGDRLEQAAPLQYYQIILPAGSRRVPLSENVMTWTSLAYILWDDLAPTLLTPGQQVALLDWLHWGGQLIVSGPDSLGALRGSFLDDYLPAEMVKTIELDNVAFQELNENWSHRLQRDTSIRQSLEIIEDQKMVGIEMKMREGAESLPDCGGLVMERQVGRGRIVVTAFHLADRPIVNWGSFDSFFNSCLFRRPRRVFVRQDDFLGPRVEWADFQDQVEDPRLTSALRFFSRDCGFVDKKTRSKDADERNRPAELASTAERPSPDAWRFGGYESDVDSGVAGWTDTGAAANAVRDAMDAAAGIEVPRADFVLQVLAVYLVILVPVNWSIFRLIRRVEWAWVAIPLIAVAGAIAVVRLAQLDIGFARSRTEISVVELHGGYRRAHLTRYTRLYTSLATSYSLSFADESTVARPFALKLNRQLDPYERPTTVTLRRQDGVTLSGFKVPSNSERAVHSEQYFEMGGSISLVQRQSSFLVDNQSDLELKGAAVFRRSEGGTLQRAWIGELSPKSSVSLQLENVKNQNLYLEQWNKSFAMSLENVPDGELNLATLAEMAVRGLNIRDGECRLIAWTDAEIPGVTIYPRSSQTNFRTIFLAHLIPGTLPPAEPDTNSIADVTDQPLQRVTDPDFQPFGEP